MPPPVALAITYFVINFVLLVWIVREETDGRAPAEWILGTARTLRYGPPLLGLGYLVTIAGDWPFFLFILFFFGLAFWMLDGLLNYGARRRPKR